MKNNFIAKHAQRSGSGFHSETSKPVNAPDGFCVKCLTCDAYSDIDMSEYNCPACGSTKIIEIGGLQ